MNLQRTDSARTDGAQHRLPVPAADQLIPKVHEYLNQEGISVRDFAFRVGYSRETINQLLAGKYSDGSRTDGHLQLRQKLFTFLEEERIANSWHDGGALYETANVRLIRKHFDLALNRRRAVCFRGAPGAQKTYVLRRLIDELNQSEASKNGSGRHAFYIRCNTNLSRRELLRRTAKAVGARAQGAAEQLLDNIRFQLRRRQSVLVFDEAQGLGFSGLEAIRELLDENIGMIFAGSHQLEEVFGHYSMRQWHSRIYRGEALPGLSEKEALSIIHAELGALPDSKVRKLIDGSYDVDFHNNKKLEYISARRLFWSIDEIREQQSRVAQTPSAVKAVSA